MITKTLILPDYRKAHDTAVSYLSKYTMLVHSLDFIASSLFIDGAVVCVDKHNCLFVNPSFVNDLKVTLTASRDRTDRYILSVTLS